MALFAASFYQGDSYFCFVKYPRIQGAKKLSSFVKPMLAESSSKPAFSDSNYVFEIKYDGYRAIAECNGDRSRLYSRNGTTFSIAFTKIFEEIQRLPNCIIDGEIVVYDENNKPSFQLIQNYSAEQKHPIQFQVFDILQLDGKDLSGKTLVERKSVLKELLPKSSIIQYCEHIDAEGELLFQHAIQLDLEGIIAKKKNSKYKVDSRCKDWLKIKNHKFDEFVIVGFLHTKMSPFKSLVLADIEEGKLEYRGHVSGFSNAVMSQLHKMLSASAVKAKAVPEHERFDAEVTWCKPLYKCNVRYTEITDDGILRHPIFQGLVK
jgi:bifunctional non-homologous end joining protein LigD